METALEHLMREGLREEEAVAVYGKREAIRSEVVKVTQRVFGIEDEIAVQAHGLVKWAGATLRAVMAPMGRMIQQDKAETTQRMVTAFEGKIRHGIAAHVQSGMQRGIMAGVDLMADAIGKAQEEEERKQEEAQLESLREHGVLGHVPEHASLPMGNGESLPPVRLPGDTVLRPECRGMEGTPAPASIPAPAVASATSPPVVRGGAGESDVDRLNAAMTHPRSAPLKVSEIAALDRGLAHLHPEALIPVRAGYRVVLSTGKWIYEQLSGSGSAGSTAAPESNTTGTPLEKIRGDLQEYLGPDYRSITNKSGDKVFLSRDGGRRVRFDVKNPHGDKPHMHIEVKDGSRWKDGSSIHRIHFKE